MNLREARAVHALYESRHFGRAAAATHVTTPTLSHTIAQLERRLGFRLFDRTTRTVVPTAEGEALLPAIEAFLDAHEHLECRAITLASSPIVRVGTFYGRGAEFVAEVATAGVCSASVRHYEWSDPTCGLADGEVDAAILAGPLTIDPQLTRIRLWTEDRVAVLASHHHLNQESSLVLAQVDDAGWVRMDATDAVWHRFWRLDHVRGGRPPELGPPQESATGLMSAVRSGDGVIIATRSYARIFSDQGLVTIPVIDVPPVEIDLAYVTDRCREPQRGLIDRIGSWQRHDNAGCPWPAHDADTTIST
ncbi:MAG: LysR family transcriptional regulator [Acidimicrobiales bacterium]